MCTSVLRWKKRALCVAFRARFPGLLTRLRLWSCARDSRSLEQLLFVSLHPQETWSWALTIALVVNYIQQPLPEGSTTGADGSGQPGALGMGQQAATGLTTCKYFCSNFLKTSSS